MNGYYKLYMRFPNGKRLVHGDVVTTLAEAEFIKAETERTLNTPEISVEMEEICKSCYEKKPIYDWGMCRACCEANPCYNCRTEEKCIDACATCWVTAGERGAD